MQSGKVLTVIGGIINVVVSVCAIIAIGSEYGSIRQFLFAGTIVTGLGVVLTIYGIIADLNGNGLQDRDERDSKISDAMTELREMKDRELVSDEEFVKLRKKLIDSLLETLE